MEVSESCWLLVLNAYCVKVFRPCLWIALQVPWFWWGQGHCRFCLNQCVSLGKHWLLKKTQEGTLNTGVGKCNRSNSSLLFVGLTNSLVQCTHMTHGFPVPTAYFPLSSFRLSLDNTEAELHSLFVRTRSLQENIQRDGELCQQMQDFLQVCWAQTFWFHPPARFAWVCLQKQQAPIHTPPAKSVKGTLYFRAHSLLGGFFIRGH